MLTALLTTICFATAVLFTVLASWLRDQAFRRSARANLLAAACCVLGGALLTSGGQALPVAVLVLASVLGAMSLHAVRVGRG